MIILRFMAQISKIVILKGAQIYIYIFFYKCGIFVQINYIAGRLSFAIVSSKPVDTPKEHFYSIEDDAAYVRHQNLHAHLFIRANFLSRNNHASCF